MMRRTAFKFSIALAWLLMCSAYAQQNQNRSDGELHILPVQGNIYMLVGAGANITVSVGKDGIMLVDAGTEAMSERVQSTVLQLQAAVTATAAPNRCVGLHCSQTPFGWTSPSLNAIISSPAP